MSKRMIIIGGNDSNAKLVLERMLASGQDAILVTSEQAKEMGIPIERPAIDTPSLKDVLPLFEKPAWTPPPPPRSKHHNSKKKKRRK